jgi:uridine kinase
MSWSGILVVTGSSGAGKTAAVERIQSRSLPGVRCHYFDRIGIPSAEAMSRDYGGPEAWQSATTRGWIKRLAAESDVGIVSVLDAQTRPSFVVEALAGVNAPPTRVVLLDCALLVRHQRLIQRGQAELVIAEMDDWAVYLRREAEQLDVPIIDTSVLDIDGVADALEERIRR